MSRILQPIMGPVLIRPGDLRYNGGARGYAEINLLAAALDSRITFTRSSPKTYIDSTGALQTAAINVDPLEYDPVSHGALGRSFWDNRTNLVLNSATLVTQSITTTAQSYALSFYGTGTVTLSGTATGSLVGTGASTRVIKVFTATAGTLTLTVSGNVTLAMCEAGTTAGPYIATGASTVLRGADAALVLPLSAVGLSASAGTVYAEALVPLATNASAINTVVGLSDNTATNSITMTLIAAGVLRNRVLATSQQAANDLAAVSYGSTAKMAFSYAAASFAACANGGTPVVTSSGTLPVVSQVDIGKTGGTTSRSWNSTISRLRFYPHALSAAELQAITS